MEKRGEGRGWDESGMDGLGGSEREICMRDKGGGLGWSFCVSIAGGEQGWRKERERGDVCDGRMVKGGVGVESVLFPFLC